MNAKARIDKAGRLVLPKPVRDSLRIAPGDILEIEVDDSRVTLSVVRERQGLHKEHEIWVYRSGQPSAASIPDLIDQQRNQRTTEML